MIFSSLRLRNVKLLLSFVEWKFVYRWEIYKCWFESSKKKKETIIRNRWMEKSSKKRRALKKRLLDWCVDIGAEMHVSVSDSFCMTLPTMYILDGFKFISDVTFSLKFVHTFSHWKWCGFLNIGFHEDVNVENLWIGGVALMMDCVSSYFKERETNTNQCYSWLWVVMSWVR